MCLPILIAYRHVTKIKPSPILKMLIFGFVFTILSRRDAYIEVKTDIKKGHICPGATFNPILSLYPGTHNENAYPSLCDYAHKHVFKQLGVQRKSYEELVKSKECKYVFISRHQGAHG